LHVECAAADQERFDLDTVFFADAVVLVDPQRKLIAGDAAIADVNQIQVGGGAMDRRELELRSEKAYHRDPSYEDFEAHCCPADFYVRVIQYFLCSGSTHGTSSADSTAVMVKLTTIGSWSLRTTTHMSGSSTLALIS
jgi:hypothetical protein